MTKNVKSIFFVLTLVMLLVTVGAVSAADNANSTTAIDTSVNDVATVSDAASDTVAAEPVTTTSNDNVDTSTTKEVAVQSSNTHIKEVENTITNEKNIKEITKQYNNDTLKTASSKTYTVNDFDTLHNALTSNTYTTLTLNIKSDITLEGDNQLNSAIKTLIINGNGKTIDGGHNYLFLKINSGSTVTIENLKITNCYNCYTDDDGYGGAINNYGTLTITNTTLNNNQAYLSGGAIRNKGALTITNTTLNNNQANHAGAIDNGGTLTITNTTLNNNNGKDGSAGAINNYGNLTITNTTLNNNTAGTYGGAICNSFTLTITNTTLNNNNATWGGAIDNGGTLTITNTTLNNNQANSGGAINNFIGTFTITNTTFNNNTAEEYGGAIENLQSNSNIIGSNFTQNTANYGGAINNYVSIDNYGILTITNTTLNNNTAEYAGGAIRNNGTLTITNTTLNNNTAESGGAIYNNYYANMTEIDGEIKMYLELGIYNTYYANMTLTNNIITNNNAQYGGAIYNTEYATMTLTNNTLTNNTAESGGAIYNTYYANMTEQDKEYLELGIYNTDYATMTLTNNVLTNNNAQYGGAIYNTDNATMTLTNNTLIQNTANYGGAIDNNGNLTITNTTLNNNNVKGFYDEYYGLERHGHGGAIYNEGNLKITNTTLNNNNVTNAGDFGGAIDNVGNLTITNTTLNNNEGYFGGAINNGGNLTITNTTLNNNTANYGGAIRNMETLIINKSTLNNNNAGFGGAIYNEGNIKITNTTLNNNNAREVGGGAIITYGNLTVKESIFTNNTAQQGSAIHIVDKSASIENNNFTSNRANVTGKAIINSTPATISNNTNADISRYNGTIYSEGTKVIIRNNIFDIGIVNTKTTVQTFKGIIGEKLTIKATVTDINNQKVTSGNLLFKLNGVTIKDNGKLTGSSNPLKVKVTNGVATTTITPDLNMRNANKLTAHYIGTDNYNASSSNAVKIQISQRNASIVISSNVKTIKQGQVLTLTAKVYDTTNGKKSTNLTKYPDEFVYFKVNGITLKDSKGNMLKVKIVNGTATTKYTIPLGLSGITDGKTMTPKNHTILAGFYNKNYQENIRNTSTFQVERSNITITISNVTVNNKTHKLSLTATIKDYLGNKVVGPNKCIIKINGVSLKNGTKPIYYFASYGVLNIKNINIPSYNKYSTIEIVTQDRLAYKSQRNTTTVIKVTN